MNWAILIELLHIQVTGDLGNPGPRLADLTFLWTEKVQRACPRLITRVCSVFEAICSAGAGGGMKSPGS